MQAQTASGKRRGTGGSHVTHLVASSLRAWPTRENWAYLHGFRDLTGYLQAVRETSLRAWVDGIDAAKSDREIDQALRNHFTDQVRQLARFAPDRHGRMIRWMGFLPHLPVLKTLPDTAMPVWDLDASVEARDADLGDTPTVRGIAGERDGWQAWLAVMRWHAADLLDDHGRLWTQLDGVLLGMLDQRGESRLAPLPDGEDSRLLTVIRDGGENAVSTASWIVFLEHTRRILRAEIDGRVFHG